MPATSMTAGSIRLLRPFRIRRKATLPVACPMFVVDSMVVMSKQMGYKSVLLLP